LAECQSYNADYCPTSANSTLYKTVVITPAVADEKYFYHSFVSPCFALECPVLQGISGICEMCVLADILAK